MLLLSGYLNTSFNFSAEMLTDMLNELNRLITKYSGEDWSSKPTANRLVELLSEHTFFLQAELNEVQSGGRMLSDRDFLGPKTRSRRELKRQSRVGKRPGVDEKKKQQMKREEKVKKQMKETRFKYFNKVIQHKFWKKRRGVRTSRQKRKNEGSLKSNLKNPPAEAVTIFEAAEERKEAYLLIDEAKEE